MIMNFQHIDYNKFHYMVDKCLNRCDHSHDVTRQVLKDFWPDVDIEETIKFLESKGGYCDCEVLMNAFKPDNILYAVN